jgi:hypothetical protein
VKKRGGDINPVEARGSRMNGKRVLSDMEVSVRIGGKLRNIKMVEEELPVIAKRLRQKRLRTGGIFRTFNEVEVATHESGMGGERALTSLTLPAKSPPEMR